MGKLRKDMEVANSQHESILASLNRKQQDAIQEMSKQVVQLQKMKAKIAKDKSKITHEIQDTCAASDEVNRSKCSLEKSCRALAATHQEISKKVDQAGMTLGDYESNKRKMASNNADLLHVVGEMSNAMQLL